MATYNTAFGSLPGYNEMLGTTNTTGGGQQQVYGQRAQQQRQQQQPAQTFAQMQQRGMARPAPPQAPQAQPFGQFGGSQQAQQMRQRLQSQLEQFGQAPSRFDTQAFQQIRGAQAANLQQEYRGQLQALNEEMARRGLSASSVGGGRMGDLAGQQARALASLDAELLQRAAETQAQDRAQLLAASQGLAELAGSQDLAQFEANRVAQAATFENQLRAAQFGQQQFEQAGQEAFQGAQAEEAAQQAARAFDLQATGQAAGLSMDLQRLLGQQEIERAGLTGQLGGMQTLAGRQFGEQQRQFDIQQALQAQLGLGGLSLEQQRFAEQARQFGQTLAEQQAGRLQQAGLSQQEINLRAQQLQQEAATQGRQLSLEEARLQVQQQQFGATQAQQQAQFAAQLGISQQELGLRNQQLQQEAQQFGLQLSEQQASRMQQYGLSVQELGLQSQRLQQDAALQGRQLSIQEASNQAQVGLEQQKIANQAAQFGLQLNEQQIQRVQQFGLSTQELALRTQQVQQEGNLQGRQLTLQEAQNVAQNQIERERLAQQGQQFGVTTAEQQRQFNIQQALQQQLGLGGLGLQQAQFGLEQQRFVQQAQDAAAERELRQILQTRELTAQERQQLTDIQSRRELQTQQLGVQQAESAAERDIRLRLQSGQITADQAQQERQIAAQQALQTQQLGEQGRQFNIEQALRQQLGLGGLDIQRGQLEEQRAGRLQQLGISQQELGLRARQLQQEADLQGRQLSIQEAQNQAGNQLERDRLIQQGQQFGLQLDETKAARLQQYGLSTQELGLQAQRLQQDAALQGRQLSITEAQNLAQNQLEQQRVTNQAAQFGLQLNEQQAQRLQQGGFTAQELALESQRVANQALQFGQQLSAQERQNQAINSLEARKLEEDANFRSQQLGLNRDELEVRKNQIKGDLTLRGIEIDDQRAYREAEIEARTQQIQNEFLRSGQQIDVDKARIQAQKDISDADNTAQMNRLEAQITAQASESALERRLRGALGMAETTGFVFDPATGRIVQQDGQNVMTVQGRSALAQQRLAENQFLMQLISSLGNVDLGKSIKDLIDRREPIDKNQTYDPRSESKEEERDTGRTDQVKGRVSAAYESNPSFMDNLSSVLDQPAARATSATPSSSTLQALAAALGISPAALQSFQTGTTRTSAQSALSGALSGLQPNATSGSSSFLGAKVTPTLSSSTREALRLSSYKPETQRTMSAAEIQRTIQQRPDYQAMQSRLMSLPREQQNKYIKTEELFQYFPQGPFIPEEAMPGTVYFNYNPTKPAYLAYDGVGFRPLTPKVESIGDPNDPIRGIVYRLPDGTRWA